MKNSTKYGQVRLTADLMKRLGEAAAREGRSLSNMAERILLLVLAKQKDKAAKK